MSKVCIRPMCLGKDDLNESGFRSLFDSFLSTHRPLFAMSERVWSPPADMYETADSVMIKMEIAGVRREHLDISVDAKENVLVIAGCRKEHAPIKKEDYQLMEIRYGHFERFFPLPAHIRRDEVQAQYNNGFLIVSIPKKISSARKTPIEMVED